MNGERARPWRREGIMVAVLLGCFAFAVVEHARTTSATFDETCHLPAGYSCLAWHDFRLCPEHPPLVREWAALPLLLLHVWPATMEPSAETVAAPGPSTLLTAQIAWTRIFTDDNAGFEVGHLLLYGVRDEVLRELRVPGPLAIPSTAELRKDAFYNDADRLLLLGRLQILVLGLLLAVLVFAWARELHGPAGAVLALALYCFDPSFVAHSSLVTTDVGATLFMFGALYFLWRTCRRLSAMNVLATGAFLAFAFATKLTAILLVPMFALVGLARVLSAAPWPCVRLPYLDCSRPMGRALGLLGATLVAAIVTYVGLWATYGFRYSAARDPSHTAWAESALGLDEHPPTPRQLGFFPVEFAVRRAAATKALVASGEEWPEGIPDEVVERAMPTAPLPLSGELTLFAMRNRLLPEAYLYGLAYAEGKSRFRSSFLLGQYSNTGFRSFFPLCFLLKTPILSIAAIVLALVWTIVRRGPGWLDVAFLMIPVAVYFAASIHSNLNIGHRHLLPVYPFLFVLAGTLARPWQRWRASYRTPAAVAAIGAVALSSVVVFAPPWDPSVVFPHYLAYFNELAGGPRRGFLALVDSSLDWGQELKDLKAWLDEQGISEPIGLSYFGTADPRYYGIRHVNVPGGYGYEPADEVPLLPSPGYFAVSATNLQGPYYLPGYRESLWRILRGGKLAGVIGYTIFVFRLEAPAAK